MPRVTGTLKFWKDTYGFASTEFGDVFVHESAFEDRAGRAPQGGDILEMNISHNDRGLQGHAVIVVLPAETAHALKTLTKLSAWNKPADLARERDQLLERYPDLADDAEQAIARGIEQRKALARLETTTRQHGADVQATRAAYDAFCEQFPEAARHAAGRVDRIRRLEARNARPRVFFSAVEPSDIDHRVLALKPSERWTVLIDETGQRFEERRGQGDGQQGRFVGLVVPQGVSLPALAAGFHAAEASAEDRDKALQAVLDAHVGVFGVTVDDLPPTAGDRWIDGVLEVTRWILRLLPIEDGARTRVDVLVEERGIQRAGLSWDGAERAILQALASRSPERAAGITLDIRLVSKTEDPRNGYVDIIAHTWGSKASDAHDRLLRSGLAPRCLHAGDGRQLRRIWDQFGLDRWPSATSWRWLLSEVGATDSLSLAGHLLERLGRAIKQRPELWIAYLEEVHEHLESKAVNLRSLGAELDWLERYQPDDSQLPPRDRLLLVTACLAEENHRGLTPDTELLDELRALSLQLEEEDTRIVLKAALHLAVSFTNTFDFASAADVLRPWLDMDRTWAPRVCGLLLWGRLVSSAGQHRAFEGDLPGARALFVEAIETFSRLSDPGEAAVERSQTSAYLAIAAMDDTTVSLDSTRELVENITGPISEATVELATAANDATKYAQHLLVRYLVKRGTADERAAYVAQASSWREGWGHPWPLVLFYRAQLVGAQSQHFKPLLASAFDATLSRDQGPVVTMMGTAFAVVAKHALGEELAPVDELLGYLERELPKAAPRLQMLRRARSEGETDAVELLEQVLPFNFH